MDFKPYLLNKNPGKKPKTKNGRACCVHFFKSGFSLIELLIVISILALSVSMSFIPGTQSEEKQAIEEAKNLADWFERAFIKSNITKQRFQIIRINVPLPNFYINWISASSNQRETYESRGRALFTIPQDDGTSVYNPLMGYLEGQFGMTIRVYRGSDTGMSKIIRYVIISRFGRVRVSESPPP